MFQDNIRDLHHNGIAFVSRLPKKMNLSKDLIADNLDSLENKENLFRYYGRFIYVKPRHHGLFVIVSSRPMATDKISPIYYTCQ